MRRPTLSLALVVVTALLVVTAGVCMFDDDASAGHRAVVEACCGVLATTVMPVPFLGLLLLGWAAMLKPASVRCAALFVLDPPPKPALLG